MKIRPQMLQMWRLSIPQHAALSTVKNALVHNHPPRCPRSLPQPTTPVRADRLEKLLHGYSLTLKTYLIHGFNFGFRVHFQGERRVFEPPNLKSAIARPDIVRDKLTKEIHAGRIAGPFCKPPFPSMFCSPLGIVPKKNPSEFRLIQHLSFPRGYSIIMTSFLGIFHPSLTPQLPTLFRP